MAASLPSTMRAAEWTKPPMENSLKVNPSAPLPPNAKKLPKDSALVKVAYASTNPVDHKLPEFGGFRTVAMGKAPWIPVGDYSGTVVESNLPGLKAGQRVMGNSGPPKRGVAADYAVIVGVDYLVPVPDGVSLADAATLGTAASTAYQCIEPFVKKGDKVLIRGASGGVGHFNVQIAKILGCEVTAVCSGANVEFVKGLGADHVIDYKAGDVVEEVKKSGTIFDLIVDNVSLGGPLLDSAHLYSKPEARYIMVAGTPSLEAATNAVKSLFLPGFLGGSKRKGVFIVVKPRKDEYVRMMQWIAEGKLKPAVEKTYDLTETGEAFARQKSGRAQGKILIKVGGE